MITVDTISHALVIVGRSEALNGSDEDSVLVYVEEHVLVLYVPRKKDIINARSVILVEVKPHGEEFLYAGSLHLLRR